MQILAFIYSPFGAGRIPDPQFAAISGLFDGYWPAVIDLFSENRSRFSGGDPLPNAADKQAGY